MKRYLKIWYLYSVYSTQVGLQSRFGAILFVIGKFLRFGLFLFFIFILSSSVKEISGYNFWQMIFIFATFNLLDVCAQLFLREVYHFREYVITGSIDYFLVRPIKPIFKFLFGGADVLDVPLFIVSLIFLIISFFNVGEVSISGIFLFLMLLINALLIALSFHIFILSIAILTTEIDNTLWLYRDLISMGKIPIDLYRDPIRSIITFAIPVGIMVTFPAKAMFGSLSLQLIILSFLVGLSFLTVSSLSWRFALKRYSSASS